MKKIIKPHFVEFSTECPVCGCAFSYEYSDIGTTTYGFTHSVDCPHCKHPMQHNSEFGTVRYPTKVEFEEGDNV